MADLLLHSMAEFREVILSCLEIADAREIVEVGSEEGSMTKTLIDCAAARNGRLVSIDPEPSNEARRLFEGCSHAALEMHPSLEVLADHAADAYLIDGDHNYYTVLNESRLIWEATRRTGRDLLVFYHDVGWPWARRDLYYTPCRIPASYRHPHTFERGIIPGDRGTVPGGFRGEGRWACALLEGGPRNGVLTAIEDFVAGKEDDLCWASIPAVFGLGILFDRRADWAEEMSLFLTPYHANPLLERMERNRLDCYLRVLALQDDRCEADV